MSETTSSSPKLISKDINQFSFNELFISQSPKIKNNNNQEKEKIKENNIEKPIIKYNFCLKVKCFKWNHNSHKKYDSFFDYESKKYSIEEYIIDSNGGTIADYYNSLKFYPKIISEENSTFSTLSNQNRFFLKENLTITYDKDDNFIIHTNQYTFFSCKYFNKNSEFLNLRAGCELKIGKYLLKVNVIKIGKDIQIEKPFRLYNNNINNNNKEENTNEAICKICLSNNTNESSLINVCNCIGSMKYVHYECILIWIEKKSKINYNIINPHVTEISLKNYFCEICKKPFPIGIIDDYNNCNLLINSLLKIDNFCLLQKNFCPEFISRKEEFNENEYILIDLSNTYKNNVTIGRSKESLLHLNNSSVSRNHCLLYLDEEKNIKIFDNKSKFGTLLRDKSLGSKLNYIKMNNENSNITLQKGNTVYNFSYTII